MISKSTNDLYFNAYFEIQRKNNNLSSSSGIHPLTLATQLIQYPLYCIIIQIWIHIEAFWLFVKGVPFIPHPEGSETAASKIIASLMIPFFTLKEWLGGGGDDGSSKGSKED
uniref:Uncharacterized protein n=1 Tax=Ditylum brightwellii TaxID=49249 RepID=A0A7S4SM59_9STRA